MILNIVAYIGVIQIYFKKEMPESNKRFGHFLLILSGIFTETLLINIFGATNPNPIIVYASLLLFVLCLALPPSMYLYLVSLIQTDETAPILEQEKRHYAPALILLFVNTVSFVAMYNLEMGTQNYLLIESIRTYVNFVSLIFIFFAQVIFYIFLGFQLYKKRKVVLIGSQGIESNNTLLWMKRFLITFTFLIVVLYAVQLNPLHAGKDVFRVLLLLYTVLIVFYGNKNHEYILENIKDETLDDETRNRLVKDLQRLMSTDKPYLNSELTIHSLSQQLSTNTKYLSYIINKEFGLNFNSYINKFRIDEAKRIFKTEEGKLYTMEAISEQIGFRSKSTFNSAFKKYTNMTPSRFRSITVQD